MILAFLFSFLASSAQAMDCGDNNDIACEVTWSEAGNSFALQLFKGKCEFPEGHKSNCAQIRVCQGVKLVDIGASQLMEKNDNSAYCLVPEPIDLLVSSQANGPSAFVECDKNKKRPTGIRLNAPTKKSVLCTLPAWRKKK